MPSSFDEEVTLQRLEGDVSLAKRVRYSRRSAELFPANEEKTGSALLVTKLKGITKILVENLSNQGFVKVVKRSLINFFESIDRFLTPVSIDGVTASQANLGSEEFKETLSEGLLWWPLGLETFYSVSIVQGDSSLAHANHIENKCRLPDGVITAPGPT